MVLGGCGDVIVDVDALKFESGGRLVSLRDGMPVRRSYREIRMPLTVHA